VGRRRHAQADDGPDPDETAAVQANIATQTAATAATKAVAQARKTNAPNLPALEQDGQAKTAANATAQQAVAALPAGVRFFRTPRGIRKLALPP
jgi:multidrug efflux pump subunit AcrB